MEATPKQQESSNSDEDSEEAELRRKIIAMGGQDPRELLKQQRQSVEEAPQQRVQPAELEKIVFSDTEGSELDESESSGDEKFIAQMMHTQRGGDQVIENYFCLFPSLPLSLSLSRSLALSLSLARARILSLTSW